MEYLSGIEFLDKSNLFLLVLINYNHLNGKTQYWRSLFKVKVNESLKLLIINGNGPNDNEYLCILRKGPTSTMYSSCKVVPPEL